MCGFALEEHNYGLDKMQTRITGSNAKLGSKSYSSHEIEIK